MARLEYLLGDWAANLTVGGLIGAVCAAQVTPDWSIPLAMLVGMLEGMGIAMILAIPGGILLGGFELMLPLMLTGMLAGMAVAMGASMEPLAVGRGALWGLGAGAVSITYSTGLHLHLRGEARVEP